MPRLESARNKHYGWQAREISPRLTSAGNLAKIDKGGKSCPVSQKQTQNKETNPTVTSLCTISEKEKKTVQNATCYQRVTATKSGKNLA